jgi:acyl-CoA dehydrogenase
MTTSSPFYSAEHEAFRDSMRAFVRKEIEPFVTEWDEAGTFPRELYKKAAEIGLIPLGYPEQYGGIEADLFYMIIAAQELAMAGCGGVCASLMSHGIGTPPIVHYGSEALKRRVLPPIFAGEAISALAITEPGGGSDVAGLKTTAKRDGEHYIVNGSKTFITSGMRADTYTVAVRTGGPGHKGLSVLVIDRDTPGFTRTPLQRKMGWWCSDTATLYFDNCRVPAGNLLGEENQGSKIIMNNFNAERIFLAASCIGFSRAAYEEVADYARQRQTFGRSLIEHQVVRHKLADMHMKIEASQAYLEKVAWRIEHGENPVADVCLLKNQSTLTMEYCAREAVQTMGGAGYLRGPKSERIYREVRVNAIGGGAEEIMRDLAARQLGL